MISICYVNDVSSKSGVASMRAREVKSVMFINVKKKIGTSMSLEGTRTRKKITKHT